MSSRLERSGEEALLESLVAEPGRRWPAFLETYTPELMRLIARRFRDRDDQMNAYVFVCEALAANDLAKVRRFLADRDRRQARFATWLAVVVRNLCIDWRRSVYGRRTLPAAVRRLGRMQQLVFRYVFWEGRTCAEALELLGNDCIEGVTLQQVHDTVGRLRQALPESSRWAALAEYGASLRAVRIDAADDEEGGARAPVLRSSELA